MGNINDYVDKSNSQADVINDFLIITNGTEEYNISISEFFQIHTLAVSHDHSAFIDSAEATSLATIAAGPVAAAAVTNHETTYDHTTFIDSLEAGIIADTHIAAYFPKIITNIADGDMLTYDASQNSWINSAAISTTGYTGTFTEHEGKTVTVNNGLIVSVELSGPPE